jgi:hypothetical protein
VTARRTPAGPTLRFDNVCDPSRFHQISHNDNPPANAHGRTPLPVDNVLRLRQSRWCLFRLGFHIGK